MATKKPTKTMYRWEMPTLTLLVLITLFVATPITVRLSLDLQASTAQAQLRSDKPILLTVKQDLSLSLGGEVVARDGLVAAIEAATNANHNERIIVRADRGVSYSDLMAVAEALVSAGYKVAVLVQPDEQR